ncbi:hypothetical protein CSOJ01_05399 [Colletotrichum sojae]|uniref:Protein kinase domain-containing protein n=1 Tax=Colletotrichum sojae TaxID=2175907 RepID=A0A8H6JG02_9PEZI|nr:hypothetical protein CSOJ01_05399 [Colletotrichum sojae]
MPSGGGEDNDRVYDDFIDKDLEQPYYGECPSYMDAKELGFDGESAKKMRTELVRDYRPSNFDTDQQKNGGHITLTILKSLSGGPEAGPQVLLCKTPLLPRQLPLPIFVNRVVVKIYDPLFYPWVYNPMGPPWNEATLADLAFTHEAAAYDKFQEKGLLGKPHLAPGYLGAFTVQLNMFNPQVRVEQRTRYVGAIILEYVEGHRMSVLCDVDVEGRLIPKLNMEIDLSEKFRLEILQILLDGYVRQLYAGVEQCKIRPENILISKPHGDELPRVALLDYTNSTVDEKREKPLKIYEGWLHPPHPFTRFGVRKLSHLAGWFPINWVEEPVLFDQWLRQVFGNDVNSAEYSVELEGQVATEEPRP